MGARGLGRGSEAPPTPPPQSSTPPPVANLEGGGVHARRLVAVLAVVSMASFADWKVGTRPGRLRNALTKNGSTKEKN